jgi:AraC-like DNA-binding protein
MQSSELAARTSNRAPIERLIESFLGECLALEKHFKGYSTGSAERRIQRHAHLVFRRPDPVAEVATRVGLSERQLERLFVERIFARLQLSPMHYVEILRTREPNRNLHSGGGDDAGLRVAEPWCNASTVLAGSPELGPLVVPWRRDRNMSAELSLAGGYSAGLPPAVARRTRNAFELAWEVHQGGLLPEVR